MMRNIFPLTVVLGIFGIILVFFGWPALKPEQKIYPFYLPATVLGCVEYEMKPGDHIAGWEIDQPIVFTAKGEGQATVDSLYFRNFCPFRAALDFRGTGKYRTTGPWQPTPSHFQLVGSSIKVRQ